MSQERSLPPEPIRGIAAFRGVAQPGRAADSKPACCTFNSCRPCHFTTVIRCPDRVTSVPRKEKGACVMLRMDLFVASKTISVQRTYKFRAAHAVIGFFALVEFIDKFV